MIHKKTNKKQKNLLDIPPASVGEWNAKIDLISRDELYDDEAILRGIRRGMQQALAGDYRPAREVLDEIDKDD